MAQGRLDVDGAYASSVSRLGLTDGGAHPTTQSSTPTACVTAARSVRRAVQSDAQPPLVGQAGFSRSLAGGSFTTAREACSRPYTPTQLTPQLTTTGVMEPSCWLKLGDKEYRTRACKGVLSWVPRFPSTSRSHACPPTRRWQTAAVE